MTSSTRDNHSAALFNLKGSGLPGDVEGGDGGGEVVLVMYLADEDDASTIYVFASKAGAPTHPDWYYNLSSAGSARVEVGTETYDVTVSELAGEERDPLRGAGAPIPSLR